MHECSSDRKKTFSFNMCFPGNIDRKIWTFWSSHFFLRRIVGAFSGAGEFCFTCACDSFWIRTWVAVNAAGWNDMQLDRGGCKPPFFWGRVWHHQKHVRSQHPFLKSSGRNDHKWVDPAQPFDVLIPVWYPQAICSAKEIFHVYLISSLRSTKPNQRDSASASGTIRSI
jgi:hypothetical protein